MAGEMVFRQDLLHPPPDRLRRLIHEHPDPADVLRQVEAFSAKGCRVLLLALDAGSLDDDAPSAGLMPPQAGQVQGACAGISESRNRVTVR